MISLNHSIILSLSLFLTSPSIIIIIIIIYRIGVFSVQFVTVLSVSYLLVAVKFVEFSYRATFYY
jgi:hypothetical protein